MLENGLASKCKACSVVKKTKRKPKQVSKCTAYSPLKTNFYPFLQRVLMLKPNFSQNVKLLNVKKSDLLQM